MDGQITFDSINTDDAASTDDAVSELKDAAADTSAAVEFTPSREEQESTMQFPYGPGSIFDPDREMNLTPAEERVYLDLNLYSCWQSGKSHAASYNKIADRTGLKVRTVRRAIDKLIKVGYIEKNRRGGQLANTYQLIHHLTDEVPLDDKGRPLKNAVPIGEGTPLDPNGPPVDARTTVAWYKVRLQSIWTTGIVYLSLDKMRELTGYAIDTCRKIREKWRKLGIAERITGLFQSATYQLWPKPYKERRKRKEESFKGMPYDKKFYYSYNRRWRVCRETGLFSFREVFGWRHANEPELKRANSKIHKDFMELRVHLNHLNEVRNAFV